MRVDNPSDDLALVEACRRGRGEATRAFSELVRRYEPRVYRTCLRMLRDPADAEDVCQDIFVRVFRKLHSFEGRSRFSTWLFSIARNECLSALKKRADRATESFDESSRGAAQGSEPGVDIRYEQQDLLEKTLANLSPEDREVLTLRFVAELQIDEIAVLAEISLSAAKMRLYRAMERFSATAARLSEGVSPDPAAGSD